MRAISSPSRQASPLRQSVDSPVEIRRPLPFASRKAKGFWSFRAGFLLFHRPKKRPAPSGKSFYSVHSSTDSRASLRPLLSMDRLHSRAKGMGAQQ